MNSGQENAPVRSIRCSIGQLSARLYSFFIPGSPPGYFSF